MTACPWDADRPPSLHPDGEVILISSVPPGSYSFFLLIGVYYSQHQSRVPNVPGGETLHPNIPSRWRFEMPRSTKLLASSGTYIISVDKRGIQKRSLGGIRNGDLIPITEVGPRLGQLFNFYGAQFSSPIDRHRGKTKTLRSA